MNMSYRYAILPYHSFYNERKHTTISDQEFACHTSVESQMTVPKLVHTPCALCHRPLWLTTHNKLKHEHETHKLNSQEFGYPSGCQIITALNLVHISRALCLSNATVADDSLYPEHETHIKNVFKNLPLVYSVIVNRGDFRRSIPSASTILWITGEVRV